MGHCLSGLVLHAALSCTPMARGSMMDSYPRQGAGMSPSVPSHDLPDTVGEFAIYLLFQGSDRSSPVPFGGFLTPF